MGLWDNFKEEYETPKDKEGWTELECIYAGEGVSKNGNEMLKVQVKTPMGIKLFHYVVFGTENTNRNFTITLRAFGLSPEPQNIQNFVGQKALAYLEKDEKGYLRIRNFRYYDLSGEVKESWYSSKPSSAPPKPAAPPLPPVYSQPAFPPRPPVPPKQAEPPMSPRLPYEQRREDIPF